MTLSSRGRHLLIAAAIAVMCMFLTSDKRVMPTSQEATIPEVRMPNGDWHKLANGTPYSPRPIQAPPDGDAYFRWAGTQARLSPGSTLTSLSDSDMNVTGAVYVRSTHPLTFHTDNGLIKTDDGAELSIHTYPHRTEVQLVRGSASVTGRVVETGGSGNTGVIGGGGGNSNAGGSDFAAALAALGAVPQPTPTNNTTTVVVGSTSVSVQAQSYSQANASP